MSDPSAESYVRVDDAAQMVAIAPWQFVSADNSRAAVAARDAARQKKRNRAAARAEVSS